MRRTSMFSTLSAVLVAAAMAGPTANISGRPESLSFSQLQRGLPGVAALR